VNCVNLSKCSIWERGQPQDSLELMRDARNHIGYYWKKQSNKSAPKQGNSWTWGSSDAQGEQLPRWIVDEVDIVHDLDFTDNHRPYARTDQQDEAPRDRKYGGDEERPVILQKATVPYLASPHLLKTGKAPTWEMRGLRTQCRVGSSNTQPWLIDLYTFRCGSRSLAKPPGHPRSWSSS